MEKHTDTCSYNDKNSMGRCSCIYFNVNHPLTDSSSSVFQLPEDNGE